MSRPYPNPFNNQFSFLINIKKSQWIDIQLYDIIGRNIQHIFKGELSTGKRNFSVKTDLPTGIYLLKIQTAKQSHVRKILHLK